MTSFGRGVDPCQRLEPHVIGVPRLWNCASLLTLHNKQVITLENSPMYAAFYFSLIAFAIIGSIPVGALAVEHSLAAEALHKSELAKPW